MYQAPVTRQKTNGEAESSSFFNNPEEIEDINQELDIDVQSIVVPNNQDPQEHLQIIEDAPSEEMIIDDNPGYEIFKKNEF